MWDLEEPKNKKNAPLCETIVNAIEGNIVAKDKIKNYFKLVYRVENYIIIKIN